MVHQNKLFATLLVATLVVAFGFADNALAATKKKLTYDQAFARCKSILDKEKIPGTLTSNDRYSRGGACMHHYGYKL